MSFKFGKLQPFSLVKISHSVVTQLRHHKEELLTACSGVRDRVVDERRDHLRLRLYVHASTAQRAILAVHRVKELSDQGKIVQKRFSHI